MKDLKEREDIDNIQQPNNLRERQRPNLERFENVARLVDEIGEITTTAEEKGLNYLKEEAEQLQYKVYKRKFSENDEHYKFLTFLGRVITLADRLKSYSRETKDKALLLRNEINRVMYEW